MWTSDDSENNFLLLQKSNPFCFDGHLSFLAQFAPIATDHRYNRKLDLNPGPAKESSQRGKFAGQHFQQRRPKVDHVKLNLIKLCMWPSRNESATLRHGFKLIQTSVCRHRNWLNAEIWTTNSCSRGSDCAMEIKSKEKESFRESRSGCRTRGTQSRLSIENSRIGMLSVCRRLASGP